MFNISNFNEIAGVSHGIEAINPCLVARIRRAADNLNRYEISVRLADAVTEAADAAHTRAWEETQFGEASADTIVDCEYFDEIAAAWSLIAIEHQLINPETIFAYDGSVH